MNGPLLKDAAAKLATRILADKSNDQARLSNLYLQILNRPITSDELRETLAFVNSFDQPIAASDKSAKRQQQAWSALCHALFASNEFLFRL